MRSWKRKVALMTFIFWTLIMVNSVSMSITMVYAEEKPITPIIFATTEPELIGTTYLENEVIFDTPKIEPEAPGAVIDQPMDIYEEEPEPENLPMDSHLTKSGGVFYGPSGKETYYNLSMSRCLDIMRGMGYNYECWVRDDGVKMYGYYVMVAANTSVYPKGTIIDTSMGKAMVVDHCPSGAIDICVSW